MISPRNNRARAEGPAPERRPRPPARAEQFAPRDADVFKLADRLSGLRGTFSGVEALELLAGLALYQIAVAQSEFEGVPGVPPVETLRTAEKPEDAGAIYDAIRALKTSEAFRWDGEVLDALRLDDRVAALLGLDGGPQLLDELVQWTALALGSEGEVDWLRLAVDAAMSGPNRFRAGELYTPPPVADLMARLLAPEPGSTIYDPTCGTGGLLIEAAKWATEDGGNPPRLFGQDLNPAAVALARVRAHVWMALDADLAVGDVLLNPAHVADGGVRRFDYVVANLPLGVKLGDPAALAGDSYGRFGALSGQRRAADAAFLLHVVASLGEGGRAVVAVAPTVLWGSGSDRHVREALVKEDLVEAVVALPTGLYAHASVVAPPLLVLNRAKAPEMRGRVLFVEAEAEFEDLDGLIDRIEAVVRDPADVRRFSAAVDVEAVKERGYTLVPSAYVTLIEIDRFMGGRGRRVPLSELADVLTSSAVKHGEGGTEPIIKARDLRDRVVSLDELDRVSLEGKRHRVVTCEAGDVLLQEVGQRPVAVEAPAELAGAVVHRSVLVVRPKEGARHLAGYLEEFFNSDLGQAYLTPTMATLGGVARVSARDLRALQVPIPDDAVLQLISEIRSVERDIIERHRRARDLRDRLFTLDEPERFDEELRRLKTESEVLARSLVQVDSLSYRVRNFYPFPVAYRYRELEGIGKPHELHKSLLAVAEGTLAYLGSVGLALAAHVGALGTDPDLGEAGHLMDRYWRSGATLGNWRDLGYRSARAIRKHAAAHPVPAVAADFAAMWFEGRGQQASAFYKETTDRLGNLRNDEHHGRGPASDAEYERENDELRRLLDDVFAALAWTVAYPLRLVRHVSQDWERGTYVADTVLYTGDHPGLRSEQVPAPHMMPDGHLYLVADDDTWISLYPLVTVQFCPSCKRSETYFVDRWEGTDRRTGLKSFERGHPLNYKLRDGVSEEARTVSQHLEAWLKRVTPAPGPQ